MRNSSLDIYMIIIVMMLTLLTFFPIMALVREIKIAKYPNYYRNAARKECNLIFDVLSPSSCCLDTIELMAKNNWLVSINNHCPGNTVYSKSDCPGSIALCIQPDNKESFITQ